jgi:L-ascorbate metabolism protein UlaG (beta-lactamase superfamily)
MTDFPHAPELPHGRRVLPNRQMSRRILTWIARGMLALGIVGGLVLVLLEWRPSLAQYDMLVMPPAPPGAPLTVRFAGTTTLVFDDGETVWMTDGFFSRPHYLRLLLTKIEPDQAAIQRGLEALDIRQLAAVVPMHSHYDHAMDSALIAKQTQALLIGSESTLNIGKGVHLPNERMRNVSPGERIALGKWTLTFIQSRHAPELPIGRPAARIDEPLVTPARYTAWGEGDTWAIFVAHASGPRMLILGSAGYVPGGLEEYRADTVFLAIARQESDFREQWWAENVKGVGAGRVIPTHWDDLSRPLDQPLVAFPHVSFDDIGATMAFVSQRAKDDGIELRMPPKFTAFVP